MVKVLQHALYALDNSMEYTLDGSYNPVPLPDVTMTSLGGWPYQLAPIGGGVYPLTNIGNAAQSGLYNIKYSETPVTTGTTVTILFTHDFNDSFALGTVYYANHFSYIAATTGGTFQSEVLLKNVNLTVRANGLCFSYLIVGQVATTLSPLSTDSVILPNSNYSQTLWTVKASITLGDINSSLTRQRNLLNNSSIFTRNDYTHVVCYSSMSFADTASTIGGVSNVEQLEFLRFNSMANQIACDDMRAITEVLDIQPEAAGYGFRSILYAIKTGAGIIAYGSRLVEEVIDWVLPFLTVNGQRLGPNDIAVFDLLTQEMYYDGASRILPNRDFIGYTEDPNAIIISPAI